MSELKIDMKQLKKLDNAIDELIRQLKSEKEKLLDNNYDVFLRYMAFHRLSSFMTNYTEQMNMLHQSFQLGADVMHEFFRTPEFKKRGWDNDGLHLNPFFVNEDDDDDSSECDHKMINGNDLPEEAKKALAGILIAALKESGKSS